MVWHLTPLIFGHLIRRPRINGDLISGEHLTLGRAIDLFLAAKAAEGAETKTLDWYEMILRRAVRGLGEEGPIEQFAGPELRAWILERQWVDRRRLEIRGLAEQVPGRSRSFSGGREFGASGQAGAGSASNSRITASEPS